MDLYDNLLFGTFLSLLVIVPALSLPMDAAGQLESQNQEIEKRPKYMDTRDLDVLEQFIWETLVKFVKEGRINPEFLANGEPEVDDTANQADNLNMSKRRRRLSMCVRRQGRHFVPFPCYKTAA